jgi:hypothetical protein
MRVSRAAEDFGLKEEEYEGIGSKIRYGYSVLSI